jgi:hypothetical protein
MAQSQFPFHFRNPFATRFLQTDRFPFELAAVLLFFDHARALLFIHFILRGDPHILHFIGVIPDRALPKYSIMGRTTVMGGKGLKMGGS